MKKYNIYISFLIILILVINFTSKTEKSFVVSGIKYAVSIDGNTYESFPNKGSYKVDIACSNAKAEWDYEEWNAEIFDITGEVTCNVYFASEAKNYLNSKIINLNGTTQGIGQVVNENGYRYEGKNPNNYIKFNNELWRIIGVFDSTSHRQEGEYLTKIIKNDPFGGYQWRTNNNNIWSNGSLYNLLNNNYYNATDGTGSENCYIDRNITGNCNYTNVGIKNNYRMMIKNVTWYLGGLDSEKYTVETFYNAERSNDDTYYYQNNRSNKTTNGYVGLIYVSDYGYSSLSSSCTRTTYLGEYNSSNCAGTTWLNTGETIWTITHLSSANSLVLHLSANGSIGINSAYWRYAVRPTLYLDSSVYILGGTGSEANPYIIGI